MKIQTTKILVFSIVLSGIGFAALRPGFSANSAQSLKLSQLGYGHAPHPPLSEKGLKLSQLGYGHAPHPPLGETQGLKLSQLGYGHAPHPPLYK
jgi:hypothetical protein